MPADDIVIASYARTPMGSFQGCLTDATATQLGAAAVVDTGSAITASGVNDGRRRPPERRPDTPHATVLEAPAQSRAGAPSTRPLRPRKTLLDDADLLLRRPATPATAIGHR